MNLIDILENRLALAREIKDKNGGYCTYKEAAMLIGVDPATIRMYTHRGILNNMKIGKKSFVSLDELGNLRQTKIESKIEDLRSQLKALGAK